MKKKKDSNTLTITEMSNLTGVKRQTLQLFESMGLLLPMNEKEIIAVREENLIRNSNEKQKRASTWRYKKEDVFTVNVIQIFHMLEYPYEKIKKIFDKKQIDSELKVAHKEIDNKINELMEKKKYLEYIFERESSIEDLPQILKEYFWTKYVKYIASNSISFPVSKNIELLSKAQSQKDEEKVDSKFLAKSDLLFLMLITMSEEPEGSKYVIECLNQLGDLLANPYIIDVFEKDENDDEISYRYAALQVFEAGIKTQYERKNNEAFNQIVEVFGASCLDLTFKLIADYLINIKKQYPEKADNFESWDETIKELYEDMDDDESINAE